MHRKVLNSLVLILSTMLIAGCSTSSSNAQYYRSSADSNLVASPTAVVYSSSSILIYSSEHPPAEPFEVITTIQIPLYNEYGIMRQQARINQMLKDQARSLGGNALILIPCSDKKHSNATIILIKPRLVGNEVHKKV